MASSGSGKKTTNMRRISLTQPETLQLSPAVIILNEFNSSDFERAANGRFIGECKRDLPHQASALRIVATPTVGARAKSRAVHRIRLALDLRASLASASDARIIMGSNETGSRSPLAVCGKT